MSSASSLSAGISSLPNQRYKIILDKGINFNMMVCGESGTGKTTFINTLLTTIVKEPKDQNKRHSKQLDKAVEIEVTKIGMRFLPLRFFIYILCFRNRRTKIPCEFKDCRYSRIW